MTERFALQYPLGMAKLTPGQRLQQAIKAADETQRYAAAALDIAPSHLSSIIKGRETPGLHLATRIQDLYGILATDFGRVHAA